MSSDIVIKIENLSKKYWMQHPIIDNDGKSTHDLWALKDVNLEIRKGESLGIIGPNGCGKSTLLKIIAGVTKPTSGRIEISGRVASLLDIGAGFHPEISGRDNVFLNGQLLGFSKKNIKSKFDEIVDFSGIKKFIDEPVKNYSNGMHLRLAFSIMTQLEADIYLFDEVLSVGDAEFRKKALNYIEELKRDKGKVFLIATHNRFEALHYCTSYYTPNGNSSSILHEIGATENIEVIEVDVSYDSKNTSVVISTIIDSSLENLDVVFIFENILDGGIFATSSIHPSNSDVFTNSVPGKTKFKSTINSLDIVDGDYRLSLSIVSNKNEKIATFENVAMVKFLNEKIAKDEIFFEFYPGAIRYFSKWHKESL